MPLSAAVNDRHSLIRQYLEERFPLIDATKQGALLAGEWKRLLGITGIERKPVHESPVLSAQRRTVGTALDYRLRYYFRVTPSEELVAARGAQLLLRRGAAARCKAASSLVKPFFAGLDALVRDHPPVARLLDGDIERQLARYCLILAHFEALFRAGIDIESPLYTLTKGSTLDDLLAVPSKDQVQDLCALARDCHEDGRELFPLPSVPNPKFEGSVDIGGGDADLIVGDCLFEIKTVTAPHAGTVRDAVYQLLGYALLDYSDRYGIRRLGVWLTRQRCIWALPLAQLLAAPAALLLNGPLTESNAAERLAALRGEVADMLKRPKKWAANGRLSFRMLAMPEAERIAAKLGIPVADLIADAERRAKQVARHELFVDELIQDMLWEIEAEAERGQRRTTS